MTKYTVYIRTSTSSQLNGLDAQQAAVDSFIKAYGGTVEATFTEQESGAKDNRQELQKALAYCKKHGATLLVSKLDRISRKVSFISQLMESSIDLRVCDLPNSDTFQLHIYAALAEQERKLISRRTSEALAVRKAAGVKLGCPLPQFSSDGAVDFAMKMKPIINDLQDRGFKSLNKVASQLNEMGIPTRAGGKWYARTVKNTLSYVA